MMFQKLCSACWDVSANLRQTPDMWTFPSQPVLGMLLSVEAAGGVLERGWQWM